MDNLVLDYVRGDALYRSLSIPNRILVAFYIMSNGGMESVSGSEIREAMEGEFADDREFRRGIRYVLDSTELRKTGPEKDYMDSDFRLNENMKESMGNFFRKAFDKSSL